MNEPEDDQSLDELITQIRQRLVRCVADRDIELLLTTDAESDIAALATKTLKRQPDGEILLFGPAVPILVDYYLLVYRFAGPDRVSDPRAAAFWLTLAPQTQPAGNVKHLDDAVAGLNLYMAIADANAGMEALQAFNHSGDTTLLDVAVDRLTASVEATSETHAEKLSWMSSLASALSRRFDAGGNLADLVQASELRRTVIAACPKDHPQLAFLQSMLAAGLITLAGRTTDPKDIDDAINAARWAATHTPAGHEYRALRLARLGEAYVLLFRYAKDSAALRQAITTLTESVHAAVSDADTLSYLGKLVSTYDQLVVAGGGVAALNEKVALLQGLREREDIEATKVQSYLGNAYYQRYEATSDKSDLEQSLQAYRRVVEQRGDDGIALSNLSNALREHASRSGDRVDLDDAIDVARRAVAALDGAEHDDAMARRNLAVSLIARYELTDDHADLDSALVEARTAVQHMSNDDPQAFVVLSTLGAALATNYEATRQPDDLDEAIRWIRAALDVAAPGTPGMAAILGNASDMMGDRFDHHGEQADLDACVLLAAEAVDAADDNHVFHWRSLKKYGKALERRYRVHRDSADLSRAVEALRQSATLAPVETGDAAREVARRCRLLAAANHEHAMRAAAVADAWTAVTGLNPSDPRHASPLHNLLLSILSLARQYREAPSSVSALSEDMLTSPVRKGQLSGLQPLCHRVSQLPQGFPPLAELDDLITQVRMDPEHSDSVAWRLRCLAVAHELRSQLSGDDADLSQAVARHQEALAAGRDGPDNRFADLVDLANALLYRFGVMEDPSDLNTAVRLYREAVNLATDRFTRVDVLMALARAFEITAARSGEPADHDELMRLYERLLAEPAVNRGEVLAKLLTGRINAHQQGDDITALEAAMRQCEDADLAVRPGRFNAIIGLFTTALRLRYWARADHADVQRSITLYTECLAEAQTDDDRAEMLAGLGISLRMRFNDSGDEDDLDAAVQAHREADALKDLNPEFRIHVKMALSNSLQYKAALLDDRAALEDAIVIARECANTTSRGSSIHTELATILSSALMKRFSYSRRLADLDEAVALIHELTAEANTHADRGLHFALLGDGYYQRYEVTVDDHDLDTAIGAFRASLEALPPESPRRSRNTGVLGDVLYERFMKHRNQADLDAAVELWREGATMVMSTAYHRVLGALSWGRVAMAANDHHEAARAYDLVGELMPQTVSLRLSARLRREHLGRLGGAASEAAAVMLAAGRQEDGVEMLEQTRSVLWNQLLNLRTELPGTGTREQELAARMVEVRQLLDTPFSSNRADIMLTKPDHTAELTRRGRSRRMSAELLEDVGHLDQAIADLHEAVEAYRVLNHETGDAYLWELADALRYRAWLQMMSDQRSVASRSAHEAVSILRRLTEDNRAEFALSLASALHIYAFVGEIQDGDDILAASREATALYEAAAHIDGAARTLATSSEILRKRSRDLANAGRWSEALETSAESIDSVQLANELIPDVYEKVLQTRLTEHVDLSEKIRDAR
jgi:hypothetical protein